MLVAAVGVAEVSVLRQGAGGEHSRGPSGRGGGKGRGSGGGAVAAIVVPVAVVVVAKECANYVMCCR